MLEKIKETSDFLKKKTSFTPEYGIVLGSGLGGLVNEINVKHELDYSSIPNFPVSTVKGHSGKLIFGTLSGKNVVAMQGRFHFYEGYTMKEVTFPIRVMKAIGVERLLLSNASGGMNPEYKVGDIVIITDHINLMPTNPLIGVNHDELGVRFPDMSEAYDTMMVEIAKKVAKEKGIRAHCGIYAGLSGPCFETPSEYRYIRTIGADIVGMSTVPEVIVWRHGGLPCFAISVVTDLGGFDHAQKVTHEEVLEVANAAEAKVAAIIKGMIEAL